MHRSPALRAALFVAILSSTPFAPFAQAACTYNPCTWQQGDPLRTISVDRRGLTIVGFGSGGAIDTTGQITFVVRDGSGNPVQNQRVFLEYGGPGGICAVESSNCAEVVGNFRVEAYTAADGTVSVRIAGFYPGAYNGGGVPPGTADDGRFIVSVCGALDLTLPCCFLDLVGDANGVTTDDYSYAAQQIGSHVLANCVDYDFNGTMNAADLSILVSALGRHGSSSGCINHP